MSAQSDHIYEGFIRQRRNLIVMSLVLLCFELLGVQFHTINLLGNKVIIHNDNIVHLALWILLYYYLWRYFTYFNDIGDKGIINSFYSWRKPYLNNFIVDMAINSDKVISIIELKKDKKLGKPSVIFKNSRLTSEDGFVRLDFFEEIPGTLVQQENYDFNISGARLIIPSIMSLLHLVFRTRLFNEYILPYFIFVLPLLFANHYVDSWLFSLTNSQ